MLSYFSIFVCTCAFLGFCTTVNAGPWVSPALEKLDEVNDIEIYRSVVTSMAVWEERQKEKNAHKRNKREESTACYKDLGCFEASGPFGYLDMLPNSPEEISTKFFLYPGHRSRRSGFAHVEVPFGNLSDAFAWAQQGFNKSLPTKILIHGFGSDCSHIWVYELRSALMAVEEMNIICVDWSKGAELPNYVKAAANTRLVGKQLAILLRGLVSKAGLSSRSMHLIGFSLGAHVAGFAGSEIGNLSRITGLDPAGPLFESQDPRARLDQTDADFVDVIHSNGENLILGGLGTWQPLGHVDFYPNGGRMQKGCSNIFVGAVSDIIWSSAVEGRSLCNHRRAYKFFTDSVSPRCHFPAFPCETYEDFLSGNCFPCTDERNCGNMGYYADRSKGRGQLFLITRDEEPFCAHQYNVKIESSNSDIPITSYGKIQITLVGDLDLNETFMMTRKDDEEMKLGVSMSRILVPHPVLSEPTKIQILYTAYSGWLSSGLTHWKIDRVILSDSFGKISSVCKKGLLLESGTPIVLPLYPGECNLPSDNVDDSLPKTSSNSTDNTNVSQFNPNESEYHKEKLSFKDAVDIFNLPWHPFSDGKDNRLDDEKETSRALNTRFAKPTFDSDFEKEFGSSTEALGEIVEPVLRPHTNKIARSHDPDRDKHEISEPILGSTTSRTVSSESSTYLNNKEITYNFYDTNDDVWHDHKNGEKWKRHDGTKVEYQTERGEPENESFNLISMTVQFLPHRIARMFEQAEKYARETILPFVSAHTPKIIRDFIAPEETPKYLPLHFEETADINYSTTTRKIDVNNQTKIELLNSSTTNQPITNENASSPSTAYSHIQKILKRVEITTDISTTTSTTDFEDNKMESSERHSVTIKKSDAPSKESVPRSAFSSATTKHTPKEIYINLPVFENNSRYIPLIKEGDTKPEKLR